MYEYVTTVKHLHFDVHVYRTPNYDRRGWYHYFLFIDNDEDHCNEVNITSRREAIRMAKEWEMTESTSEFLPVEPVELDWDIQLDWLDEPDWGDDPDWLDEPDWGDDPDWVDEPDWGDDPDWVDEPDLF